MFVCFSNVKWHNLIKLITVSIQIIVNLFFKGSGLTYVTDEFSNFRFFVYEGNRDNIEFQWDK